MQFTTGMKCPKVRPTLFSKSKSTRFRCNSQQFEKRFVHLACCFQRAKVQDLDAIHNFFVKGIELAEVVFKEQKYKI